MATSHCPHSKTTWCSAGEDAVDSRRQWRVTDDPAIHKSSARGSAAVLYFKPSDAARAQASAR
eukprot:4469453-Prymnesium_polylepis.2